MILIEKLNENKSLATQKLKLYLTNLYRIIVKYNSWQKVWSKQLNLDKQ
ncbi:hypothetical protein ACWGPZ_30185 [Priestia megaterium]